MPGADWLPDYVREAPSELPTFEVHPVPLLDATKGLTDIMVRLVLCLPERLDGNKLRKAWYEVTSAWPLMNARVRTSSTAPSGLDYYMPTPTGMAKLESNPDPLMRSFYHLDVPDQSIDVYNPALAKMRTAHDQVRIIPAATDEHGDVYTGANAAHGFDEMLTRSIGVFTSQATTFSDGTLLSTSLCHVLADGFGTRDLFAAWTKALRGERPAPLLDAGIDAFAPYAPGGQLATITAEEAAAGVDPPAPKGYFVYNWREKARFLKNFFWDYYVTAPESEMEQRCMCIPHAVVADLQRQAADDLKKMGKPASIKVGKSDVLYAWLLKHALAGQSDSRIVNPLTIVNLRRRGTELQYQLPLGQQEPASSSSSSSAPRPKTWTWPRHEFINAALATPLGDVPVSRIYAMPLGELALLIHSGVRIGADLENSRKLLTFSIHHGLWRNRATNKLALFCRPDAAWVALTDWRALHFARNDWSGARFDGDGNGAAGAGAGAAGSPEGTPPPLHAFALQTHMFTPYSKRCRFSLMGEVDAGVYMGGFMARRQWEDVQRGFGRYEHVRVGVASGEKKREASL